MPDNFTLLFMSFWFSTFFFMLSLANSLLCFSFMSDFDVFLSTLLCILCSYELARKLTLRLTKYDKE